MTTCVRIFYFIDSSSRGAACLVLTPLILLLPDFSPIKGQVKLALFLDYRVELLLALQDRHVTLRVVLLNLLHHAFPFRFIFVQNRSDDRLQSHFLVYRGRVVVRRFPLHRHELVVQAVNVDLPELLEIKGVLLWCASAFIPHVRLRVRYVWLNAEVHKQLVFLHVFMSA